MFPSVVNTAVTNGSTAATSQAINLPASIRKGDMLLAIVRNAVACTYTWPAGWTELHDASDDGDDDETTTAWRESDGTDGSTVTITATSSGKFAGYVIQIRNARPVAPRTSVDGSTGTSAAQPQSALNNNSTILRDYLYVSLAAMGGEATVPASSYPSGYTLGNNTASSGTAGATTSNCIVAGAAKQVRALSDTPGAFSFAGTLGNWTAFTYVFDPAEDWVPEYHSQHAPHLRR
jgi:hypothetical protein